MRLHGAKCYDNDASVEVVDKRETEESEIRKWMGKRNDIKG